MGYLLKTNDKNKISTSIEIGYEAAELVREKIKEVKKANSVKVYGVNAAIQTLLCELYKLKKSNQLNQGEAS